MSFRCLPKPGRALMPALSSFQRYLGSELNHRLKGCRYNNHKKETACLMRACGWLTGRDPLWVQLEEPIFKSAYFRASFWRSFSESVFGISGISAWHNSRMGCRLWEIPRPSNIPRASILSQACEGGLFGFQKARRSFTFCSKYSFSAFCNCCTKASSDIYEKLFEHGSDPVL